MLVQAFHPSCEGSSHLAPCIWAGPIANSVQQFRSIFVLNEQAALKSASGCETCDRLCCQSESEP